MIQFYEYVLIAMLFIITLTASIIDSKKGIIPNLLTYPCLLVAILAHLLFNASHFWVYAAGMIPAFLFLLLAIFTQGSAVGGGDIKYLAVSGLILGFWINLFFIFFSFMSALIQIIYKKVTRSDATNIKMGPHFLVGLFPIIMLYYFIYSLNL